MEDFDIVFGLIDSPAVGWNLDIGHANIMNNLAALLARHGGRLINCHVHDNDGVADSHRPIGRGTVDWPATFRLLAASGYRGPLHLEFSGEDADYQAAIRMIREYGR